MATPPENASVHNGGCRTSASSPLVERNRALTSSPIEKIAQSIQVLTRALIDDQDLRTLSDALANVSGVTPTSTFETVLQSPLVRGFNANYYIDGLPAYGLPTATVDPATLIGVARIEVAKGPSSTLYGGGTGAPLGGLINLVSPLPDPSFGGQVTARAGSFDTYGATGDISVPFGAAAGALGSFALACRTCMPTTRMAYAACC